MNQARNRREEFCPLCEMIHGAAGPSCQNFLAKSYFLGQCSLKERAAQLPPEQLNFYREEN